MACRKALEQNDQDYGRALAALQEMAAEYLRLNKEAPTVEGRIEIYAHHNGRLGVLADIGCQTEFASRTETFLNLAHAIALQIASTAPRWVRDEEIPQPQIDEFLQDCEIKYRLLGKPETLLPSFKAEALEMFKTENVLLRQKYIRNEAITVAQLIDQAASKVGENITVRRFVRWETSPEEAGQDCASGAADA